eukprot:GHVL01021845.1.p1 GENE.GHVL01021845.1~~GHVL01021845.1.p1  ORF type:complete len:211 (+),score=25.11 GHVL01021845.1:24-656(+)
MFLHLILSLFVVCTYATSETESYLEYSDKVGVFGLRHLHDSKTEKIISTKIIFESTTRENIKLELFSSTQLGCTKVLDIFKSQAFLNDFSDSDPKSNWNLSIYMTWSRDEGVRDEVLMNRGVECEEAIMTDFLAATYLHEYNNDLHIKNEIYTRLTEMSEIAEARKKMVDVIIALENFLAYVRKESADKYEDGNRQLIFHLEIRYFLSLL